LATAPTLQVLEQFLFHEARLIDEKRWDEWGALFTAEGEYWVPATRGQPDPKNHVSLMYETALLRDVRLKRYRHPNAMSLQPVPYSVHVISNVMVDSFDEVSGVCVVNSRFITLEYRRNEQQTYGGATTHVLEPDGESFRIRMKKVELTNCDSVLPSIQIYF
jgi:3-phenylpropionate/cinnamic acid dioxygenase small subunit